MNANFAEENARFCIPAFDLTGVPRGTFNETLIKLLIEECGGYSIRVHRRLGGYSFTMSLIEGGPERLRAELAKRWPQAKLVGI